MECWILGFCGFGILWVRDLVWEEWRGGSFGCTVINIQVGMRRNHLIFNGVVHSVKLLNLFIYLCGYLFTSYAFLITSSLGIFIYDTKKVLEKVVLSTEYGVQHVACLSVCLSVWSSGAEMEFV